MAAKLAFGATRDYSGKHDYNVKIATVNYTAPKPAPAEPAPGPDIAAQAAVAARRAATLQSLRENRQLFTAEAVMNRAARLKTM